MGPSNLQTEKEPADLHFFNKDCQLPDRPFCQTVQLHILPLSLSLILQAQDFISEKEMIAIAHVGKFGYELEMHL